MSLNIGKSYHTFLSTIFGLGSINQC
jgi:hypothetical protein